MSNNRHIIYNINTYVFVGTWLQLKLHVLTLETFFWKNKLWNKIKWVSIQFM